MVSEDYDNWRHGIESPNLQGELVDNGFGVNVACKDERCGNKCVSEVNKAGVPFSVWTVLHRNWGWVRDTSLRVQCFDTERAASCCSTVRVR